MLVAYNYLGDYMEYKIGDLVTRKSYNHDVVFVITDIVEDKCYLKGILENAKYGIRGIGGVKTKGTMYVGYPR